MEINDFFFAVENFERHLVVSQVFAVCLYDHYIYRNIGLHVQSRVAMCPVVYLRLTGLFRTQISISTCH